MSPEERELLKRSVELGEENHRILRSIRRSSYVSTAISITYWIIIVGSAIGAYYFIQPYTDKIVNVYNEAKVNLNNLNTLLQGIKK